MLKEAEVWRSRREGGAWGDGGEASLAVLLLMVVMLSAEENVVGDGVDDSKQWRGGV